MATSPKQRASLVSFMRIMQAKTGVEECVKLPDGVEVPMQLVKREGRVCMIPDPRVVLHRGAGTELSGGSQRNHVDGNNTKKRMARLQCGVPGVVYQASKDRWSAQPYQRGKKINMSFATRHFKTDENTWLEARYEAMQTAISTIREFHALRKVENGGRNSQETKRKAGAEAKRGLKTAVAENSNKKKLSARPPQSPWQRQRAGAGKREEGATAEAAAGAAAARGAAAAAAAAAASAAVGGAPRGSEPPDESQQSDCYGRGSVSWDTRDSAFRARPCFKSDGKQHGIGLFRPKDGSAKELERARQAAWDAIERRRPDPNYQRMPSLDEIALGKAPPEYDAD